MALGIGSMALGIPRVCAEFHSASGMSSWLSPALEKWNLDRSYQPWSQRTQKMELALTGKRQEMCTPTEQMD